VGGAALRLLLDTHVWLWALLEPARLADRSRHLLAAPESELWLSPISIWELLLLAERGRVHLDRPAPSWVERALSQRPLREASLTRQVALASRTVGVPHQDPADRFLAATAAVYDLTLVTADRRLAAGHGYPVLAEA
jgi:PIN domain nuclease of toxin-antitoxin system